jgi:arylformamidase
MIEQLVWLSHALTENTPAYGGGKGMEIRSEKQIRCGDTCNTSQWILSSHVGTHVDAQKHFIDDGLTVDQYEPHEWIFIKPYIVYVMVNDGEIIGVEHLERSNISSLDVDLLIIRTGYEKFREKQRYWEQQPAYAPELAEYLGRRFASFSAIGMDTLSISSLQHRALGREAHRAFLEKGYRIFEDLHLRDIPAKTLIKVFAMPLRIMQSDGAPCTIIGMFK